ncbi:MAG: efflux RND transporter periplasmic adaptor subunit [Desulfobacteraceae bacterium]
MNKITAYLALFIMLISGSQFSYASDDKNESKESRASVVVTKARQMTFEDRVETSGNIETRNYSVVSSRSAGIIDNIFVREGDQVVGGKTNLFQIDKVKSQQSVDISRQSVSVAEYTYRARLATVKRIEADYNKAKLDYERYQRLYNDNMAVSKNALESQESRYFQSKAALDEAKAMADLSEKQLEQERSQYIIAQKDYENSMGLSPISGYVSKRFREPGEMIGAGTPVVQVDDLSILEVSAYLPAAYYQKVITDETTMKITVGSIDIGEFPVTYKSPVIDSRLRNFEIKTLIKNPEEGVTSGDIARIKVILSSHYGIGIPRAAGIRKLDGTKVFVTEQGTAKMIPVETGLENDGWIEITSKGVKAGINVVTMGQDRLSDGSSVSILREE